MVDWGAAFSSFKPNLKKNNTFLTCQFCEPPVTLRALESSYERDSSQTSGHLNDLRSSKPTSFNQTAKSYACENSNNILKSPQNSAQNDKSNSTSNTKSPVSSNQFYDSKTSKKCKSKTILEWECPSCDMHYKLASNLGSPSSANLEPLSVAPILPPSADALSASRYCTPISNIKNFTESENILCRSCINHQNIITQLLAAEAGPLEDSLEDDKNDEDSNSKLSEYQMELEKRYPLCVTCKFRSGERIKLVDQNVRALKLIPRVAATAARKTVSAIRVPNKLTGSSHPGSPLHLALLDILIVETMFLAPLIIEACSGSIYPLRNHQYYVPFIFAGASVSLISMRNTRSLIGFIWISLLAFLRIAKMRLINDGIVYCRSPVSIPPFVALSLASAWLLVQIHCGDTVSPKTKTKSISKLHSEPLTKNMEEEPIATIDIVSTTLSDSWNKALSSLGPDTPLTAKYNDFSQSKKSQNLSKDIFSPSNQQRKKYVFASPRVSRLACLLSDDDGGLGRVFGSFSLDESPSTKGTISSTLSNKFSLNWIVADQILLSIGLLLLRIALQPTLQPAALAMIIFLAIGWRGFFWIRVPARISIMLNVGAFLRFVWIALEVGLQMPLDTSGLLGCKGPSSTIACALPAVIIGRHANAIALIIDIILIMTR